MRVSRSIILSLEMKNTCASVCLVATRCIREVKNDRTVQIFECHEIVINIISANQFQFRGIVEDIETETHNTRIVFQEYRNVKRCTRSNCLIINHDLSRIRGYLSILFYCYIECGGFTVISHSNSFFPGSGRIKPSDFKPTGQCLISVIAIDGFDAQPSAVECLANFILGLIRLVDDFNGNQSCFWNRCPVSV